MVETIDIYGDAYNGLLEKQSRLRELDYGLLYLVCTFAIRDKKENVRYSYDVAITLKPEEAKRLAIFMLKWADEDPALVRVL